MRLYIKEDELQNSQEIHIYDENQMIQYQIVHSEQGWLINQQQDKQIEIISHRGTYFQQNDIYFSDCLVASVKKEISTFVERRFIEPMNYQIKQESDQTFVYDGGNLIGLLTKKWGTYQSYYCMEFENPDLERILVPILFTQIVNF